MFDEQPDGDPHGECAIEISRLREALQYLREILPEFGGMDGRVWQTIDAALTGQDLPYVHAVSE